MRRDSEALFLVERGEALSLWRLYGWDRLCVSIGYGQRAVPDLPVPVIRRPTGGGALLHGWDISFSLADLRENWGGNPREIYSRIAGFLGGVFRDLGACVTMERYTGRYGNRFFCFFVPTFGELSLGGRKVVAVAMKTLRRSFLVHGSVYLHFDFQRAEELTGVPGDLLRKRIATLADLNLGGIPPQTTRSL